MDDSVEVPNYFICPISLQIMKDPVTTISGITYERQSIERWLFTDHNTTCPLTNQPLPKDSHLTPNHTLRRLIQAWCTLNSLNGFERFPTPRAPLDHSNVLNLLHDLTIPHLQLKTLKLISAFASDSESNRRCMVRAGLPSSLIHLIISINLNDYQAVHHESLHVLHSLKVSTDDLKPLVAENHDLIEALTLILQHASSSSSSSSSRGNNGDVIITTTCLVLKSIFEVASEKLFERLKVEFFEALISVLRRGTSQQVIKAVLHVLLESCPYGRNRTKIVDAGAVPVLVELELTLPEKRTTELVFGVLDHLCSCADGRAQFLDHAAGIAIVSKRILRVSPGADDRAVTILSSVCKYSATNDVLQEMLRVGAVSKLCFLLQANCSNYVRERTRWILKVHSGVWKKSPCINAYLLTRYP
ncbi:E3 ubiquitin-protein ligase PUB23-like [Dioscorea cayenensis subsp. rotundata]|uniref:U-box domain-containing protein n=1 Tax=Dioscorea cayennensis subsp. rotundata TaxID=55577 RepID=A0AB40BE62_DIOCR|nr:E3 ubiquitin-protein ligase PUB23-like [Dioscorea cayenensis subsp. rotundata]